MFETKSGNEKIVKAVRMANNFDLAHHIMKSIKETEIFDMSDATPEYIGISYSDFMASSDIVIKTYYPRWRWSKAIGYFTPSHPLTIYVNSYRARKMTVHQLVSLFYHESAHVADHWDDRFTFGHGSNTSKGKDKTFPCSLNRFVNDFYQIPEIETELTFWEKILKFFGF